MSVLHNRAVEAAQRRELRRAVLLSAGLHVVIVAAFYFAPPLIPRSPELPGIITVDLVALPALAAASSARRAAPAPAPVAPAPEPPPEAPPKPIPPKPREVVIPETPRKEVKPKPEPPKAAGPPEPKPGPKPRTDPPPPEFPPEEDVEYDDLLSQLRAERGEEVPDQVARADAAPTATPGGGGTTRVSPEVARWLRQADRHVKRFWVVPLGLQDAPLVVHLDVKLGADGAVQGEPRITQRSGNPWFDEGAVRAVQKASPLPPPPDAGTWAFVFRPEDLE